MNSFIRRQMSSAFKVGLLGVALTLAACGGGGGGGGGAAAAAPTVTSTAPGNSATNIARDASVAAVFSESMQPASINGGSFTLRNSSGFVAAMVGYDAGTQSATLTPAAPLARLTEYTANLSTGVADAGGTALPAAYSWSFTTQDGQWGMPAAIGVDSNGPPQAIYDINRVAVSANGDAVAVWQNGIDVLSARFSPATGWGAVETLASPIATVSESNVAIDRNGNALAIWVQKDGAFDNVYARYFVVNVGWGAPVLIEANNFAQASGLDIAFGAGGHAFAVWRHDDSVLSNRFTAGSGWEGDQVISYVPWSIPLFDLFVPSITVDAAGNALAVWARESGGNCPMHNRYVIGSGWVNQTSGEFLIPIFCSGRNLSLAGDANGNAVVAWATDLPGPDVRIERYTPGVGWEGIDRRVSAPNGSASYFPKVGMDVNGNAVVTWVQRNLGNADIYAWAVRGDVSGGWSAPERIDTGASNNSQIVEVAMAPNGNAMVLLQADSGAIADIWAVRLGATSGWGAPEKIDTDEQFGASYPQLGIDDQDRALAIWLQGTAGSDAIVANRFE